MALATAAASAAGPGPGAAWVGLVIDSAGRLAAAARACRQAEWRSQPTVQQSGFRHNTSRPSFSELGRLERKGANVSRPRDHETGNRCNETDGVNSRVPEPLALVALSAARLARRAAAAKLWRAKLKELT